MFIAIFGVGSCNSTLDSPTITPLSPAQIGDLSVESTLIPTVTPTIAVENIPIATETTNFASAPTPTSTIPSIGETTNNPKICTPSPKTFDVMGALVPRLYDFAG